jgi:group I intron endonuclease
MNIFSMKETFGKSMVYAIVCTATGDCYIGGTVNGYRRICSHRSFLKNQKHEIKILQDLWDEHGPDSFEAHIVEMVDGTIEELFQRESYWIKKAGNLNVNTELAEGSRSYRHAEKTRAHMKELWRTGGMIGMTGKIQSEETKNKISVSVSKVQLGKRRGTYRKRNKPEEAEK